MEDMKKNRAERISRAAFWFGVCVLPIWPLMFYMEFIELSFVVTVVSLVGLVLGVIGLVLSIRKQSRTRKGIVLSSIGIGFCQLSLCVAALLRIAIYGLGHPWRM